jgi:hypothetical protein
MSGMSVSGLPAPGSITNESKSHQLERSGAKRTLAGSITNEREFVDISTKRLVEKHTRRDSITNNGNFSGKWKNLPRGTREVFPAYELRFSDGHHNDYRHKRNCD